MKHSPKPHKATMTPETQRHDDEAAESGRQQDWKAAALRAVVRRTYKFVSRFLVRNSIYQPFIFIRTIPTGCV